MYFKSRAIKFIRVKSIKNSKITTDKETGVKYSTNEQIIKDISFTKNEYARMSWIQMFKRYRKMFSKKNKENFYELKIDYSKYGCE